MPPLRLRRSDRDEAPLELPRVVVMTMARDEAVMLPRWVAHYGAHVGHDNLVVLDDGTTDGSTDDLLCTVHRLPALPGKGYEGVRMGLLSGLAEGFLAAYDVAVFVDADELLVPDPARHADLRSFLAARADRDVIAPMTLNVVQVPGEEPLRADEPVLGQRAYAKFAPIMCKPSIKRVPAHWRWASHGIEAPFAVDPELYLVHLKFADRDLLRAVATHRRALVDADGRAKGSSWSKDPEDIIAAFDKAVSGVDLATVPEFDPRELDLAAIVEPRNGWYRAVGEGQVKALKQEPLRRIPSSLLGAV